MSVKKLVLSVVTGAIAMSIPAFSQEEAPAYKNEASVQAFGSFVKSTNSNGANQDATNSGGVLASYRYFFSRHQGVEANYGYALNTQTYGLSSEAVGLKTYSHEISGDYVLRFPQRRWSPFVLAGAGALVFDPKDFAGASRKGAPRLSTAAERTLTSPGTSSCGPNTGVSSIAPRRMVFPD